MNVGVLGFAHGQQADGQKQAEQGVAGHLSVCHQVEQLLLLLLAQQAVRELAAVPTLTCRGRKNAPLKCWDWKSLKKMVVFKN